jgi:dihydrodipicolinate reductase
LPDLFIDVSLAEGLEERLKYGRPMVIGTTGFSAAQRALMEEAARKVPIFYTSNFSLGMAVLKKLARDLAHLFPEGMRMEITETHHAGKKDAPSGSALSLAETIQKIQPGVEIPIESIRLGEVIGEHMLRFILPEEKIQLSHEALSRRAFAQGAIASARFLLKKPPGLYGMDELLAEKKEASAS